MPKPNQIEAERRDEELGLTLLASPHSRRIFTRMLTGLSFALVTTTRAAGLPKPRRIGLLEVGGGDWKGAILAVLREKGWAEGRNLVVEQRNARGKIDALVPLAEELVRARVEVIVAIGPNPTSAARRATSTIPIVFFAADAVINGWVRNLARPEGNGTGFSYSTPELNAKICAFLREAKPALRRVCLLETVANPQFRLYRTAFEQNCQSLGLVPLSVRMVSAERIGDAVGEAERERAEAFVLMADSFTIANRAEIIRRGLDAGIASVCSSSEFARYGALLTYSPLSDPGVRIADYVDRILRGAKPAELPVEQPSRFELVINLKTAAILGINVPRSLLIQATEVIQ